MRRTLTALILTTALATPLAAQEVRLTGTVAEVFGSQVVLATPEGRLLVSLPEGAATPVPGERLDLRGTRSGATFAAVEVRPAAGGSAPAAAAAGWALPAEIARLGLSDIAIRSDRGRHGTAETHVHGRMPDGTWVRLKLRDGRLVEAKSGEAALPGALLDAILPPALRTAPQLGDFARITEVEIKRDGEIEIEGFDARGARIEIEFFADGRLRSLDRGRDRGRDDRRSMAPAEARALLERLGYSRIGYVGRGGRHAEAIAVNPYGEWVEVRINDRGQVDRERRWQR